MILWRECGGESLLCVGLGDDAPANDGRKSERLFSQMDEKVAELEPSLASFSKEVNSLWAGLGYYRRARGSSRGQVFKLFCFRLCFTSSCDQGAKHIVENSRGHFSPRDVAELRQIPGIETTAGAIASIAFKQPVPAVDVNVIRVISRPRAISDATRESKLYAGSCKAFLLQKQSADKEVAVSVTDFPAKSIKAAPREEFTAVCVVELLPLGDDGSLFLLVQRPENGLLAGLWEFPAVLLKDPKTAKTRRTSVGKYLRSSRLKPGQVQCQDSRSWKLQTCLLAHPAQYVRGMVTNLLHR
ncbi:hypothetical protein JRQ81_008494 [Phrynocephalus forsythii]|uniref:Adenine DNA glycosylase n=1 Tax=Phrynocephalus forsythii TaxID=171643 RepID=A0A9Q0Y448_9SAUR|nr:hypothetical protein JRQ81_008494 [Phrynocephalus forsythii]